MSDNTRAKEKLQELVDRINLRKQGIDPDSAVGRIKLLKSNISRKETGK